MQTFDSEKAKRGACLVFGYASGLAAACRHPLAKANRERLKADKEAVEAFLAAGEWAIRYLAEKVIQPPDCWTITDQEQAVCRAFGLIWSGVGLLAMLPPGVANSSLYRSPIGENASASEILLHLENQLATVRQAIEDDFKKSQE